MESKRDPEVKSLDAVMESAFAAGVSYGRAAFDRHDGTDSERTREAYRLWRDRWTGLPHEPQEEATEEGRWVRATGCQVTHKFGADGWRPARTGHEHWMVSHRFDPGITGMSSMCNQLVIRNGDTDECNLPRWQHPQPSVNFQQESEVLRG